MSGYIKKKCFLLSEDLFFLYYSVDLDEMQHYAAFHLGLHSLQSTLLVVSRIQRVKYLFSFNCSHENFKDF